MAEVGHTLEYLFIGNSLTLTLDAQFWANAVKRNQEKIKDKTSEIMCFRQLRVLDVSNIVRAAENILDSVATYCDTKRLKELRF